MEPLQQDVWQLGLRDAPQVSFTRSNKRCRNAVYLGPNNFDCVQYTWRLGPWGACQNFSASDTGDGSANCGLGLRQRTVNCVATIYIYIYI